MRPRGTISVLIPTYNRAECLPSVLESVFGQTLPVDEVLLMDDGSTDHTPEVVDSLLRQHVEWRGRLRYHRQENQGKSAALNAIIPVARGEWIAFNDSDDRWMPDKLEQQFRALSRFPGCSACFTETTLQEFRQRHPECLASAADAIGMVDEPSWLFVEQWPGIYMQTVVARADAVRAAGPFDVRYRASEDDDFLFRLGLVTPFCFVDKVLVEIRREPHRTVGLMTQYPPRSWHIMLVQESMRHKWLTLLDSTRAPLREAVRHSLASVRSGLANRYVLAGNVAAARAELRKGLRDCPELRLFAKLVMAYAMPTVLRRLAAQGAPDEFLTDTDIAPLASPERD